MPQINRLLVIREINSLITATDKKRTICFRHSLKHYQGFYFNSLDLTLHLIMFQKQLALLKILLPFYPYNTLDKSPPE